jgi:aminoglycoside/choline kinase family phosphotransferase
MPQQRFAIADFHAANLMIDERGDLRIIDHQDASMGSPAYDLVSLLLDRVTICRRLNGWTT